MKKKEGDENNLPDNYQSIPVIEARQISEKYGKDQVLIFAWESNCGLTHITTYGSTEAFARQAARGAERVAEMLGLRKGREFENYLQDKKYQSSKTGEKPENWKEVLAKFNFSDEKGKELITYEKFIHVIENQLNFTDELGHPLRNCVEYRELKNYFLNAPSVSDDPVHNWFELSYAQYLTIPRSVLQSMPLEWQKRFARCLEELDEAIDWRPEKGTYRVILSEIVEEYDEEADEFISRWGDELSDPLQDYERGRRRIPFKSVKENE